MRIDQLTFTRFLAAIAIVAFHYSKETFLYNYPSINFITKNANLGVSYFFVLSGFVMVIAYQNKNVISFFSYFKNRIARIIPLHLFALFSCILIDKSLGFEKKDILYSIFLIQSWIREKALIINAPSWSLSVEFFFYGMFPFLTNRIFKKWKMGYIGVLIFMFWLLSQTYFILLKDGVIEPIYYSVKYISYHPILHLNSFLIGNLTGLIFLKYKNNLTILGNSFLSLGLIMIILISFKIEFIKYYHNGMLSPLMAFLILTIALNNKPIVTFFSKRFFLFLGEISFGIYILQKPVWSLLTNLNLEAHLERLHITNVNALFSIRLLILITISMITYKLIEIPMQQLIKKNWNFNFFKTLKD